MERVSRRDLLKASAGLGLAAAGAGCATAGGAADGNLLLAAPPVVTVPVVNSTQRFPIRRIYCVGRNYAAHSREMGSDPTREPPFFFQKPTDAIQVVNPGTVGDHPYPPKTKNYHYECELVAFLQKRGRNIAAKDALDFVYGYAVGLDMTRRDLQQMMGNEKKPWEIGKSFDHAAPMSHIYPASQVGHLTEGAIWLKVNGQTKQSSNLKNMIWSVAEQIAHLSEYYELFPGDIIYSGTPENVGPVVPGDLMVCGIDKVGELHVKVV